MAKHLNVNLQFTADTSQAASQIKTLQSMLAGLTNGSAIGKDLPITKELTEAQQAAGRLKAVLQDSLNPKGTVDIGRFTQNFKKAGLDINKLKSQMESLGPAGSKAFAQLAQSVATADAPLRKTSKLMTELSTTLKNTARWQLTSSMIHGFMGGLQEAYSYAQSLDKSLTNIRIVSGLSADEMARFAEQANKSAQALSTTTTKYTDAALIYYQQGLNDKEVKERTDTTIKMANVTGEQVQDVSSYMTAIWNNFNKEGDQAVEHYADIMTKLGAETAASTDEIAAGLSKFSAVADTVGLSFEMASSSVTAIVDQTREAPEVVGTALKTIFSRVEGLKQGETLEDGVDLNKYSQGLKNVGVDIMDASGELKDMDQILHEIGDRWSTLDKNSQVALAQTVAGVRQYNQFIALFDNWDKVEENLGRAAEAGGTLQEQADTYAESWEAAKNRVTSAAQAIYADLLDDGVFKGFLNTLAKILQGVDGLIDSFGGLGGTLSALGVIFSKVFEKQLLTGVSTMGYNLQQLTKTGKAENEKMRKDAFSAWRQSGPLSDTKEGKYQTQAINAQANLQEKLYIAAKKLDDATLKRLQNEISINQQLQEQVVLMGKAADEAEQKMSQTGTKTVREAMARKNSDVTDAQVRSTYATAATQSQKNIQGIYNSVTGVTNLKSSQEKIDKLTQIRDSMHSKDNKNHETGKQLTQLINQMKKGKISASEMDEAIMKLVQGEKFMAAASEDSAKKFQELSNMTNMTTQDFYELTDAQARAAQAGTLAEQKSQQVAKATSNLSLQIEGTKAAFSAFGTAMVGGFQGLSMLSMGLFSLKGAWDALNNPDMSFFEKLLSITMSLSMALPMVASGIQAVASSNILGSIASGIHTLAVIADTIALGEKNEELIKEALLSIGVTEATEELTEEQLQQALAYVVAEESLEEYNEELLKNIILQKAAGKSDVFDGKNLQKSLGNIKGGFGSIGKGFKELVKAGKGLLPVVGKIASKLLPVVGVVTTIIGLYKLMKYLSPEGQMDRLEKKAAAAAENFNKVSSELQNTIDKKQGLDSLYQSLENCTVGSIEWKKALVDINQQVLELINTYPELAKFLERDSNGALSIAEEGWDALIDRQTAATDAAMGAQIDAQAEVSKQKISDYQLSANFGNVWTTSGEEVNQYKAIAEVYAKNPGALAYSDESNNHGNYSQADALAEIEEMTGVKVSAEILEDAMGKYSDQLTQLVNDTEEYNNLLVQSARAQQDLFEHSLTDNENISDGNTEEVAGILSRTSQENIDSNVTALQGESKKDVKDIYSDLVLGREMTEEEEKDFNEQWKDNDKRDALLTTIAGQMATIDQDKLNSIVGEGFTGLSADAIEAANKVVNAINDNKNLSQQGKNVANQFITDGTLSGISQSDYMSLDLNKDGGIEQDEVTNYANTAFGGEDGQLSDSEAQDLGYTSAQAFMQAFADEVSKGWDKEAYEQREAEDTGLQMDEDVDVGKVKNLAKYYEEYADSMEGVSDDLKDNYKQSEKLAHSVERYGEAVEDVEENAEDWADTLEDVKDGTPDGDDVENLEEIRNAYGDMLDIDPSILSDGFVQSAENLELMEQAANGSEEAYNQLLENMQEDIIAQCHLEDDAFKNALSSLRADVDNFDDLEAGANIDISAAQSALNALGEHAFSTAAEAEAALMAMGVDAEVVEDTNATEKEVGTNITPTIDMVSDTYQAPALVGGMTSSQTVEAPQITYETTPVTASTTSGAKSFKVVSASKAAGGGFKHKSSGGGGRRGGGGGGSRRSTPRRRRTIAKKQKSEEVERYHVINNKLEDMEHQLDKISKAKDRAFGKNKLKLMDDEIAALEKNLGLQQQYQKEVEDNLQKDKNKLKDTVKKELNVEVKFDKNGTITNYNKIMDEALANYEDGRKYYKGLSASKQEALDKKYEEDIINPETGQAYGSYEAYLEAEYEKVTKAISQYEDTQDLAKEAAEQVQATIDAIFDAKLEKVQYRIELQVDVADDSLQYIDFLMEEIGDDAMRASEKIGLLGDSIGALEDKFNANAKGITEMLGNHDISAKGMKDIQTAISKGDGKGVFKVLEGEGVTLTEAEMEQLRESISEMQDAAAEARKYQMEAIEAYTDTFDAGMDKIDQYIDKFDHLIDMSKNYQEIIDVVGADKLGLSDKTLQTLDGQAFDISKKQYETVRKQRKEAERELANAQEQLAAARKFGDETLIAKWEAEVQNMSERVDEIALSEQEHILKMTEEAAAAFERSMEKMQEKISKTLGGIQDSLDALSFQFDLMSDKTNDYVDDYEKIYQLNKLSREIGQSIDDSANVKAKQELMALEDEINKAKEKGNKLSQYDLDYLRKRYELKVAELALKEAKDAKSQVRMTKDSEGNFNYVYTADEDQVENAEQSYEDKLYEMQQANAEYINELQRSLIDLQQNYSESLAEIGELYEKGSAEYKNALGNLQSKYGQEYNYITSQLQGALGNNDSLYNNEVVAYAEMTGNKAMLDQEYVGSWEQTTYSILTGYGSLNEATNAWNTATAQAYSDAIAAGNTYVNQFTEITAYTQELIGEETNGISNAINQIREDTEENVDAVNASILEIASNWTEVNNTMTTFQNEYTEKIKSLVDETSKWSTAMNEVLAAYSKLDEEERRQRRRNDDRRDRRDRRRDTTRRRGRGVRSRTYTIRSGDTLSGIASKLRIRGGWTELYRRNKDVINRTARRHGYSGGGHWIFPGTVLKYDTGGYTGKWGKEGRMAMLHQKELVLNEKDTANFLKTVDIVRQISQTIDLNALSSAGGLSSGLHAAKAQMAQKQTLEQNVHITAEFPNATDKRAILEAFDNVVNLAAQYANRKR